MNYLERIRSVGRDANPFFSLMGIEIGSISGGQATIRMPVQHTMTNGEGWLQGGMFIALADEAMVLAIYPLLDPDERIATITEATTFLGGAREGILVASGRVIKKGRRVIFAEGEVTADGSDRVFARSIASYMVSRS